MSVSFNDKRPNASIKEIDYTFECLSPYCKGDIGVKRCGKLPELAADVSVVAVAVLVWAEVVQAEMERRLFAVAVGIEGHLNHEHGMHSGRSPKTKNKAY